MKSCKTLIFVLCVMLMGRTRQIVKKYSQRQLKHYEKEIQDTFEVKPSGVKQVMMASQLVDMSIQIPQKFDGSLPNFNNIYMMKVKDCKYYSIVIEQAANTCYIPIFQQFVPIEQTDQQKLKEQHLCQQQIKKLNQNNLECISSQSDSNFKISMDSKSYSPSKPITRSNIKQYVQFYTDGTQDDCNRFRNIRNWKCTWTKNNDINNLKKKINVIKKIKTNDKK